MDAVSEAKVELAAALRAAALHGFNEGIDNHFSLAVPGREDRFLLNPFGPHWAELQASDLLTVDVDGNLVEGDGEWEASAFAIHRGVHLARPSARCVFHTHMPFATAVSVMRGGLETTLSQNATYFHGHVASVAYGGIAEAEDEGARIGAAVGDEVTVVLLENHGALVVGTDVPDAWHKLYFLERACHVQVLAHSTGQPLVRVSDAVARKAAAQWARDDGNARGLFAAVRRRLDRELPGYER
ncbi:MAG: class II aldolase/adducin family protein [Actinomycetota bacterium]|nr:class II aldolase/adducin family protein [Actinomycetota bacterium]